MSAAEPSQIKALCDQAVALHQAGRLAEAEGLYVRIRGLDPGNFTANYLQGVLQHGRGELGPALASMETALAADPNAPAPLLYRGLLLEAHGRENEALAVYNHLIALQPGMAEALVNRGSLLCRAGYADKALPDFARALVIKPDFVPALFNRATALQNLNRLDEALAGFDRTLKLDPNHMEAMGNRGTVLRALGRAAEAQAVFDQVLARQPGNAMAHYNRGVTLIDQGRTHEALTAFDRALALAPDFAEAHGNRATALAALGRTEDALAAYDRAPRDFTTLSEKAMLLQDLQRSAEALAAYDAALTIKADAGAMSNRAGVLKNMGRIADARAGYDGALAMDPGLADALNNRAQLLWEQFDDQDAAAADLERLVALAPYHDFAVGNLLHLRTLAGDWREWRELLARIETGVRAGWRAARPFVFQAISASPADLKACSEIYTSARYPAQPAIWRPRAHPRIRLGYLCGEFRDQATAILAAGLFERHDKGRFEVFAFDNGENDKSPMRARLESAFEHVVPVTGMNDQTAAEDIAGREVDILVNLNGYFGKGRMGVFARKPAPIQVNYLGFPATLGAPYIDYIVADRIVIPEPEKRFYNEKVVWLPDCYQVNDDKRMIGPATSRAAHGLPEDTFVFCNFNHGYKLTPAMFDSWMRILNAAPGSVLWLWDSNPRLAGNLRLEAECRGVAGARLIFAPTIAHADHLARLALADLALDSLPYNAHTTASDALWAGLPLITCRGTAFPGRVAASLLTAIGLPELITENLSNFEARAIALAANKEELSKLRAKLAANRISTALFDTDRTRRHIEAAYQAMWDRFLKGEAPEAFAV